VKWVKRQEVDFLINRGNNLRRGCTAYDWNFDTDVGRAALKRNFYLKARGLQEKHAL
jgi:hypothetical protein